MKVYISLPISGHELEEVRNTIQAKSDWLRGQGYAPVSPLEVQPDPGASYAVLMGNDIAALLECDAVLFCRGWRHSKGCRLEHAAARIYGKRIWEDRT